MKGSILLLTTVLWVVLLGCGEGVPGEKRQPSPSSAEVRTLSSGKKIRVLAVDRVSSEPPGPALALSYVTAIKLSDRAKLEREIGEIWADFRTDAERASVPMAIIEANDQRSGESSGFVYRRAKDGVWTKSSGFRR